MFQTTSRLFCKNTTSQINHFIKSVSRKRFKFLETKNMKKKRLEFEFQLDIYM